MKFAHQVRNFILTLRELPDAKKQIIIYSVVGVFGVVFLWFAVGDTQRSVAKIQQSIHDVSIPAIPVPVHSEFSLPDTNQTEASVPEVTPGETTSSSSSSVLDLTPKPTQ